jgi:hypothetical protein
MLPRRLVGQANRGYSFFSAMHMILLIDEKFCPVIDEIGGSF